MYTTIFIPAEHGHVAGKALNDTIMGRARLHARPTMFFYPVQGVGQLFYNVFARVDESTASILYLYVSRCHQLLHLSWFSCSL